MGLRQEDYAEEDNEAIEIWPENIPAYELWWIVGDQWRMGSGGPISLDLLPVLHELDRSELDKDEYDHRLIGIKTIAEVAMEEIQSQIQ